MKKILFGFAFMIAMASAVAFKTDNFGVNAAYLDGSTPPICTNGITEQATCTIGGMGAPCTILVSGVHKNAFVRDINSPCSQQLFQP